MSPVPNGKKLFFARPVTLVFALPLFFWYSTDTLRVAFISDLHSNIHALIAVKRFLAQYELDKVVVVGDIVGYGANPGAVIDMIRKEDWAVTIGSSDSKVVFPIGTGNGGVSDQVIEWTKTVLSPEQVEYLQGLSTSGRLKTPAGVIRFFHGSPYNPDEKINLMSSERELMELAEKLKARLVVVAGTHIPFVRVVGDTTFVDPGSVGLSLNQEPGADVAVVDMSGLKPVVKMHKVPYDLSAAAFDIMAWELPSTIADVIKTGRMG